MDSVKRNRLIAALLIAISVLLYVMMVVPFICSTYKGNVNGLYYVSCIGFFGRDTDMLKYYGYAGGGDGHYIQIVMAILTALSLLLGAIGILSGVLGLVKPDNKKVNLFAKVSTITIFSILSLIFIFSVILNVAVALNGNIVSPLLEIPYSFLLVSSIFSFVYMRKDKKAQSAIEE